MDLVRRDDELIEPFQFITAHTHEQKRLENFGDDLFLQWPMQWPAAHWATESSNVIFFRGSHTDTIRTAHLESQWLNRTIVSSTKDKVYLSFKMKIRNDLQHFECELIILDHQRKAIASLGRIGKNNFKQEANSDYTKDYPEHSILVNRHLAVDGVYKLAFRIRYSDQSGERLFELRDISFGDPCASVQCHVLQGSDPAPNGNAHCTRLTQPVVDYTCEPCPQGLAGKDCATVDYCAFQHETVSVLDERSEDNPNNKLLPQVGNTKLNGNEFCTEAAVCRPGKLRQYNFICHCPEKLHVFNMELRRCEPLAACVLASCDFGKQECQSAATGAECKCAKGREGGECLPIDVCEKRGCPAPMVCIGARHDTLEPICRCPKGFVTTGKRLLTTAAVLVHTILTIQFGSR